MEKKDTELKIQEELLSNQDLFRIIMDASPEAISLIDLDGRIVFTSRTSALIHGYQQAEELIGRKVFDFVSPKDWDRVKDGMKRVLKGERVFNEEVVFVKKDGSEFFVEINGAVILNQESKPKWLLSITRDISERKALEQRLREREESYRLLAESAQEHIYVVSKDFKLEYINSYGAGMLGRPQQELIGKQLDEIFPPETVDFQKANVRAICKNGKSLSFSEDLIMVKGNRKLYLDTQVVPIRNKLGQVVSVLGISRDITLRKEIEQQLWEERNAAKSYLDVASVIFLVIGPNMKVKLINKEGARLLGYPEHEIIGKNWFDYFVPKRIRAELKDNFRLSLANSFSRLETHENPVLTKSGEEKLIVWRSVLLENDKGEVIASLSSGEDVTSQKYLEARMVSSESKLRAVIENSPDAVILKSCKGEYELLNKNASFMIAEAHGKVTGMFLPDELKEGLSNLDKKVLKTGKKLVYCEEIEYGDKQVYFEIVKYPVLDDGGKVIFICTFCRDISEKIVTEKIRDNLIRDVSHELKTPIAMMQMANDMCQRGALQGDLARVKKAQAIASQNLARLRQDVNNVLDMFALDQNKKARADTESSVKICALEIKDALKFLIRQKKIDFTISVAKDADKLKLSGKDLHTLLYNLIDNAVKFTRGGKISITSRRIEDFVCLKVKDTGQGIPSGDMHMVFEKFYKRHPSLPGTGLGMPICKEIVRMYNGKINIDSDGEGKGTEVEVLFPVQDKK